MTPEYGNTHNSAGFNRFNRVTFPSGLRKIFRERKRLDGRLYCHRSKERGVNFLSLCDSPPNRQGTVDVHMDSGGRLKFPGGIPLPKGKLVWLGAGDHVEIYRKGDWEKIKGGEKYDRMLSTFLSS